MKPEYNPLWWKEALVKCTCIVCRSDLVNIVPCEEVGKEEEDERHDH